MGNAALVFLIFIASLAIGVLLGFLLQGVRLKADLICANNFLVVGKLNLAAVLGESINESVRIKLAKATGANLGALDSINHALSILIGEVKQCRK